MFNLQAIEAKVVIGLIALAVVLGLGFGVYYYHGKYEAALTSADVLKSQNDQLVTQIKADSDAVAKLAADAKVREDAAAAALAVAQQTAQTYQKKAQALLLAQAQTPGNLCTSADLLFNDFITGAK
jgi:uncharacterized protein HemX